MIPDITVNINNNINFYSPARQVSSETHIHRTATDMNAPTVDDDDEDDDSDSDKTITDNENNEGNESDDSSNTYQTPPSSSDECD